MEARREQIISAAARLFAEKGFHRATMADVVAASGLSNGAVYNYFPSKVELVIAVAAGRDGRVDGQVPVEPAGSLLDRLFGFFDPRNGLEPANLAVQLWSKASVSPPIAVLARTTHVRLHAQLANAMAADAGTEVSEATEAAAQLVLAALIGLAGLVSAGVDVDMDRFRRDLLSTARELGGRPG